jgi:hypothetical protein
MKSSKQKLRSVIREEVNEAIDYFDRQLSQLRDANLTEYIESELKNVKVDSSTAHGMRGVETRDSTVHIGADGRDIIVALEYGSGEKEIRYGKGRIKKLDTYKYVKKHMRNTIIDSSRMAYTEKYPATTYVGMIGDQDTVVMPKTIIEDDPNHNVIKSGTELSDLVPKNFIGDLYDGSSLQKISRITKVDFNDSRRSLRNSFTDRGVSLADTSLERTGDIGEYLKSSAKGLIHEMINAYEGNIIGLNIKPRSKSIYVKGMSPRQAKTQVNRIDMSDYNEFLPKSFKPNSLVEVDKVRVHRKYN